MREEEERQSGVGWLVGVGERGGGGGVRQGGDRVRGAEKGGKNNQEKVGLLGEIKCNFTVNLL